MQTDRNVRRRAALVAGLLVAASALGACGRHRHHHEGQVVVDNRTDLTTNEMLLDFRLAPFGEPFSGDLLGGALPPASARFIGTFHEDFYDGEGELELGMIVEWFDLFVGDGETTVFEAR
jgi:hypothetical protein